MDALFVNLLVIILILLLILRMAQGYTILYPPSGMKGIP